MSARLFTADEVGVKVAEAYALGAVELAKQDAVAVLSKGAWLAQGTREETGTPIYLMIRGAAMVWTIDASEGLGFASKGDASAFCGLFGGVVNNNVVEAVFHLRG